jgi:hypothetical protein
MIDSSIFLVTPFGVLYFLDLFGAVMKIALQLSSYHRCGLGLLCFQYSWPACGNYLALQWVVFCTFTCLQAKHHFFDRFWWCLRVSDRLHSFIMSYFFCFIEDVIMFDWFQRSFAGVLLHVWESLRASECLRVFGVSEVSKGFQEEGIDNGHSCYDLPFMEPARAIYA